MTPADLVRFFLGDADTIRRLAANPWTLAVGGVLVLSAGLARNYDTHDLRRQSWRLLLPFAASTLATAVLFLVIAVAAPVGNGVVVPAWGILGLFWLTAPLAWLYGLPFERLAPPERAARARRLTLAVVATCRVAILTRCVSVLLACDWFTGLAIVLCFAVPTALLGVGVAWAFLLKPESAPLRGPRPEAPPADAPAPAAAMRLVDAMSGVSFNFPDHTRVSTPPDLPKLEPDHGANPGVALGCLSVALLLLSSCRLPRFFDRQDAARRGPWLVEATPPSQGVWTLAAGALLFWVPWLVMRQPAHWRRTAFVELLRAGPLAEVLHDLGALHPRDFPPHWDPAAVLARQETASRMLDAALIAVDLPARSWAASRFLARLRPMFPVWVDSYRLWSEANDRMSEAQFRDLARLYALLARLPERREILEPYEDYLVKLCEYTRERDPPRREVLLKILALVQPQGD